MSRSSLVLVTAAALALVGAACSHDAPASQPGAHAAAVTPARSVLAAYLSATSSGAHARAWELLTRRDQLATSRASYVAEQQGDDPLRAQVHTRYQVAGVHEAGARADATVTVTTGLGSEQLHFVLRRDPEHWRIDYRASWR